MPRLHTDAPPLCPSAQPEMDGATIFGIVGGTVEEPQTRYLTEPQPAAPELLALAAPVRPAEVFRIAAPCAGHACQHFDGANCQLAARTVVLLSSVVESLPPCRIRPQCRWWHQEGRAACLRCPQIVTENYRPSELLVQAANPNPPATMSGAPANPPI